MHIRSLAVRVNLVKKLKLFSSRLNQIMAEEWESRKAYATKDAGSCDIKNYV